MDNDKERDFRQLGDLAMPTANSACDIVSISTPSSTSLSTTGSRFPARGGASSTGTPPSETASVPLPTALQRLLDGDNSEATDASLQASLPRSVEQALVARNHDWIDPVYGWDREFLGYTLNAQAPTEDVATAVAMVARCLQPGTEQQMRAELARLRLSTKWRPEHADDLVLGTLIYLEECAQYPIDIVRAALRAIGGRELFWPGKSELRNELQRKSRRRRALNDALATVAQGNHQTEATWQRYLRARIGVHTFDRWFKDVEVRSVTDGTVTLAARSRFVASYIKTNFMIDLCAAWSDATIERADVVVKQ